MTRRQSVVRRSSEVEPRHDGGCAAREKWIDGTTKGVVATSKQETCDDFELSVRESLGKPAGTLDERPCAHWHVPALLPQQHVPAVPPQQLP